jgi:hypothetical protein
LEGLKDENVSLKLQLQELEDAGAQGKQQYRRYTSQDRKEIEAIDVDEEDEPSF